MEDKYRIYLIRHEPYGEEEALLTDTENRILYQLNFRYSETDFNLENLPEPTTGLVPVLKKDQTTKQSLDGLLDKGLEVQIHPLSLDEALGGHSATIVKSKEISKEYAKEVIDNYKKVYEKYKAEKFKKIKEAQEKIKAIKNQLEDELKLLDKKKPKPKDLF